MEFLEYKDVKKLFGFERSAVEAYKRSGFVSHKEGRASAEDLAKLTVLEHYVTCPRCGLKTTLIHLNHIVKCSLHLEGDNVVFEGTSHPRYSIYYLARKKKTEAQKKAQSEKLKERSKTPEGYITRELIGEHSRRTNADPAFIEKKRATSTEIQNRPEAKEARSKASLAMWKDPEFRKRSRQYQEDNKEDIEFRASEARKHLVKTSKLHMRVKGFLEALGFKDLVTEAQVGYYKIDEAHMAAKVAIEVDGCYWHGCGVCGFPGVKNSPDKKKESYLRNRGWIVFRIKECEFNKSQESVKQALLDLKKVLEERCSQNP